MKRNTSGEIDDGIVEGFRPSELREIFRPRHRIKRSTKTPYYIETLAVYDYGFYKR